MLRQGNRGQLLLPWPGTFLLLLNGLQSALTSTGLPQMPGKVERGLWSQTGLSSCSGWMVDPWQVTHSSLMNLSFSTYKMGRVVILRQQWEGSIMSKIRKVLLLWRFYSSRDSVGRRGECVYSCLPSFQNCQPHSTAVPVSSHCYDKITLKRQLKGKRVDFGFLCKLTGGHCGRTTGA